MIKACGYARVSTPQDSQDGSFESQTSYLAGFINGHPEWELYRIYGDHGKSGRCMKSRPEFRQMI